LNETSPPCSDTDGDGIEDGDEIPGCDDPTACNYNTNATDPGLCEFTSNACESCSGETDGTGTIVGGDADGDGVCDADEVAGCTDSNSCAYNPAATDDDGSCITYPGDSCDDGNSYTSGDVLQADCSCQGTPDDTDNDGLSDQDEIEVYGTDPLIQDSDGDGLTDGLEITVAGTDPNNPDTDGDLCNDALEFSGDCPDSPPCGDPSCPGDLNNDGTINTGDLTSLLGQFGQTCP
jgi:hypothetical protein